MSRHAPLLTEREVADRLNLALRTIQGFRVRGGGPRFVRINRTIRYRPEDIDEFIRARIRRNTSDQGGGDHALAR